MPHRRNGITPHVLTFVIVVVTFVWAVNFLAGVIITGWEGATGVNAVMMATIGLLGAARFQQGKTPLTPPEKPPAKPPEKRPEVTDEQ